MQCCKLSTVMRPDAVAVYMNGLNDLNTGVSIFRMIQEAAILSLLELQTYRKYPWYGDMRDDWLRMLSDELNISKEIISQILHADSRERKIWPKFVPHRLTDETSCQDFIQICQENPNSRDCTVTGDQSWTFQYNPETKRQSMQWTSKSSPRPKKFRLQKFMVKTTLIMDK
jgi:hypothetical protein